MSKTFIELSISEEDGTSLLLSVDSIEAVVPNKKYPLIFTNIYTADQDGMYSVNVPYPEVLKLLRAADAAIICK